MATYDIHCSTAFSGSFGLACGLIFTLLILRLMGVERRKRAQVIGVPIAQFAGVPATREADPVID